MASWNLYDQACGYTYDSTKAAIGIRPKVIQQQQRQEQDQQESAPSPCCLTRKANMFFQCFITVQDGWGEFRQDFSTGQIELQALYGSMAVKSLSVLCDDCPSSATTTARGWLQEEEISEIKMLQPGHIVFPTTLIISANSTLTIQLETDSDDCNLKELEPHVEGKIDTGTFMSTMTRMERSTARIDNKNKNDDHHKVAGTMMKYISFIVTVIVACIGYMIMSKYSFY